MRNMNESQARFAPGQLVTHRLFGYRGVVFDVDPVFQGSDEWYEHNARSKPPRNQPWYRVLVDGQPLETYVEQRILVVMRKILAQIVREVTPPPGMKNPLSPQTLQEIREAFELISTRERELMEAAGKPVRERPRYADEPKTSQTVRVPTASRRSTDWNSWKPGRT